MRASLRSGGMAVALLLAWSSLAAAQVPLRINTSAAALTNLYSTEHNNSVASVCPGYTTNGGYEGEERKGTAFGTYGYNRGSFVSPVYLPNGETPSIFKYYVSDNDATYNSHAYLIRKALTGPVDAGYLVLADAHSTGAAAQIRKFQDITVGGGVIDNFKYTYFVEQVNCNSTIRPVNLQIEFAP